MSRGRACPGTGPPRTGSRTRSQAGSSADSSTWSTTASPATQSRRGCRADRSSTATATESRAPNGTWCRGPRGSWRARSSGTTGSRTDRAELDASLAVEQPEEEPEWRRGALERAADQTRTLEAFVDELVRRAAPPQPTTWATLSTWARELLARYLGGEGRRADWPERELDAARRVDDLLGELGSLDAFHATVDVTRFRGALDQALAAPAGHLGRFGTGLFVGPLHAALGVDMTVAAIVGGAEGTLPPHGREDPFLPDSDRAALGLPTSADRRDDTRDVYRSTLATAAHSIVCFPRADPRAEQARLPARWLLESAAAHAGRLVTAEELHGLPARPWLDVVASFEQGVAHDAEPASVEERDLRSLLEWRAAGRRVRDHPLADGALGRGYQLAAARASDRFTPFDGNVGDRAGPPTTDAPLSPTTLQEWAQCPFRYLLASVLRVRDVPRPEATDRISALDEGNLVHAILEEFVRGAGPVSPTRRWADEDSDRLRGIVARVCDNAEARGITGRELLWRFGRRRIEQTAARFLRVDEALRHEHAAAPSPDGLEVPFGLDGVPGVRVSLPGARPVTFRGRIDRVDRSPDGERVVVYDYKTGSASGYEELAADPVMAGRRLQLPVYALAALEQTGARDADAFYWFTTDQDVDRPDLGYEFRPEVRERFETVLGLIVDGIDRGCFPARPGELRYDARVHREEFWECRYCPYDRICPLDRGAAWDAKSTDPAVAPVLALESEAIDGDQP